METKPIGTKNYSKTIYGFLLPIIAVGFLLGLASFNSHPRILGSFSSDLIIRALLSAWFCGLYIRLSRFSTYSIYPNKKWTKADAGALEKYYLIGVGFLFSAGCGILTWWALHWFLPGFSIFSFVIAVVNFLIVLWPMAKNYWVLKI
jgi:hypothetical protein